MQQLSNRHNNSLSSTLSILDNHDEEELEYLYRESLLPNLYASEHGLIQDSPCLLLPNADGRLSQKQTKVFFGYQAVAWKKFGRDQLLLVPPNKNNNDDLSISHLCGTRNCCEGDHIILEPKSCNDSRTHCHHCIRHAVAKDRSDGRGPFDSVKLFQDSGFCSHEPSCCTIDKWC